MIRNSLVRATAGIGKLQRTLENLIELPRKLAAEAKPAFDALFRLQFTSGVDPYGRKWAPLTEATKRTGRRNPPLTDTGALRDGTRVVLGRGNSAGLRIVLGAPYGYFHQVGYRNARTGRKVPARRILPTQGMPVSWKRVLDLAAARIARRAGQ